MQKTDSIRKKIIIDYLKKYNKKYSTGDLFDNIVKTGYREEEVNEALSSLGLNKVQRRAKLVSNEDMPSVKQVTNQNYEGSEEEAANKPRADEVKEFSSIIQDMKKEVSKAVIGQGGVVDSLIRALLCDGHVLLEGVPGIAKTLSIKSLARVSGCDSKRVQFTVDLLPTDIVGLTTYTPKKGFEVIKGPVFTNFLIADEINRSPPKTQSALIEAMQEKQVTIGKETFKLPLPFFVMATENPLETGGVYTLPEAQIDRFLFKILMEYPEIEDEDLIMSQNTTLSKFESFNLLPITSPKKIIQMQELTKRIYLNKKIRQYILSIIELTRTKELEHGEYIEWGASPRATIALFIASKARALTQGRNFVVPKDVKEVAYEVLRHRIILSYKARVEGINSDKIISEILRKIKVP